MNPIANMPAPETLSHEELCQMVYALQGRIQQLESLAVDMDARQRLELELKQSAAAAREANEAKTRFLLNISHDIRTPMNAIIGYTSLLDKYLEEPERARGYLSKILSSSEYLLSLINNVLEMSKIESGSMTLDEKPAPLGECIHEVLQVFEGSFREKNITVHADIDLPVCSIYVDKVRIREIFLNIIGNALKYTPAGGHVTIIQRAEIGEKVENTCAVTTTVTDSGRGISPQFLPRLFEEFAQEYSSVDGINNSGTGLGMTITHHLVELMGGTIAVESTVGVGTSFKITIPHRIAIDGPTESAPPVTARAMESLTLEGRRVLLAEDNDLNAEIAMELLCLAGLKIDRACDGAECVAMLKNAPAGSYNLVLMDMQMPVMNGREAAGEIRKLGDAQKAAIPIVAMTATALDEDASWAKSLGMDGLISKPIDISAMIRVLSDILLKA